VSRSVVSLGWESSVNLGRPRRTRLVARGWLWEVTEGARRAQAAVRTTRPELPHMFDRGTGSIVSSSLVSLQRPPLPQRPQSRVPTEPELMSSSAPLGLAMHSLDPSSSSLSLAMGLTTIWVCHEIRPSAESLLIRKLDVTERRRTRCRSLLKVLGQDEPPRVIYCSRERAAGIRLPGDF
jgi:hypothetical protein